MAMTQEEFDAERMRMMQAAEQREIAAHTALMAARQAEADDREERKRQREREVAAVVKQAENNGRIADATAGTGRTAMILDAAIRRIDDRTSPTAAPNYQLAVAEVLATLAEIERQTAPAPSDPPGLA